MANTSPVTGSSYQAGYQALVAKLRRHYTRYRVSTKKQKKTQSIIMIISIKMWIPHERACPAGFINTALQVVLVDADVGRARGSRHQAD